MSGKKELARLEVAADRTRGSRCDEGFLRVRRLRLVNCYRDGSRSREYSCDIVSRPGTDAIAVVVWHREGGRVRVHLRRGTRAAIYLRREKKGELVQPDPREYDTIEEIVAGILEAEDRGEGGLQRRAAAEVHEEAGFAVRPEAVRLLGAAFFATPGITDEKVFLAEVEVKPGEQGALAGDGSVMEEAADTVVHDLKEAIAACRRGEIPDMKTEVGLLRLADAIGYLPALDLFVEDLPGELRARYGAPGL
ncbi:NUDIX hydrolase [bacterium]|nr:NUDIX hydrolase [bacterium]